MPDGCKESLACWGCINRNFISKARRELIMEILRKTKNLLIVLALVMGMVSSANATLMDDIVLDYNAGIIIVTGLKGTEYPAGFGIYVNSAYDAVVTISKPLFKYAAAGDLAAINQWPGYNGVDMSTLKSPVGSVTAGKWFAFQLATSVAWFTLDIYDYSISTIDPVGQWPTPEPATVLLLLLGTIGVRQNRRRTK